MTTALKDDTDRLGIGGNSPPPDIKIGEALALDLATNHVALIDRKAALMQMAEDFHADHPTVTDNETSGVLAGVIRQIGDHVKVADTTREGVKAPYLEGTRIVDNFFKRGIQDPLTVAATKLNEKQTAWQRAEAARIKREAEEAERKAREEEDRRRREAEKAEREAAAAERAARKLQDDAEAAEAATRRAADAKKRADDAREAEERARLERQQQAKVATSSAADRSRVRGDFAMASLQTTWKFRVTDISKVPPEFLLVNEPMVNACIRGKNGRREIPGLEIYPDEQSKNR